LGFRKTPLIAGAIVTIGFLGIGTAPLVLGVNIFGQIAVFIFYLIAMVGNGLMFPILTAGTKRFSNKETQNPAFNFWYLSMNIGAALLFLIDYVRRPFDGTTPEGVAAFREAGGNAHMLWYMAGLTVVCWFIIYFLIKREDQFPEFGEERAPVEKKTEKKSITKMLGEVFRNKAFHKVLGVLTLTIPAHIPFVLVFVMYPKYWTRVVSADLDIGRLSAINPVIIVVGLILLAPVVKKFNVYWVLFTGMMIGALSMMILAIPPQWVASIMNVDMPSAYLTLIYCQIVVFAVGEAIWSPQLMSYVGSFAPEGSEGTFLGIARFPHTTAKLVAGTVSGFLLAHFCPDGMIDKIHSGELGYFGGPEAMNLIMAIICLISPIGLLIFKKSLYVEKKAD
ncbi:MFS transporter, partial [Candidatus Peregrinibacteria bacterium]|nr:MFS transporter [Candidatus Peregrinibacteria bacterium]